MTDERSVPPQLPGLTYVQPLGSVPNQALGPAHVENTVPGDVAVGIKIDYSNFPDSQASLDSQQVLAGLKAIIPG